MTHELRFEDFSFRHVTLAYVTREFAMSTALDSNGHYSHRKVNNSITQLTIILMDNKLNQKKLLYVFRNFRLNSAMFRPIFVPVGLAHNLMRNARNSILAADCK